jgi:hemerythrin-like domain-containing protein
MDVTTRLDYFRKEHEDFLRFLEEWERALETTASKNPETVVKGLNRLRELQANLKAIENHCSSEERNVEGSCDEYLDEEKLEQLKKEHMELRRLVADLFSELRFATLYETEQAVATGREVAGFTRRHIQFEEKLLEAIEQKLSEEAEEKLLLRYTQAPE